MNIKRILFTTTIVFLHFGIITTMPSKFIRVHNKDHADSTWTVVGAGPAGITIVGLLLELQIPKESIVWIDPEFNAGRLGMYYNNVPSNAPANNYIRFLQHCSVFNACHTDSVKELMQCDPEKEYNLSTIIKPLQDITKILQEKVTCINGYLTSLQFENNEWTVEAGGRKFTSHNVVLATGSHPRTLDYQCKNEISLDRALDKHTLSNLIEDHDTIALIGGSHSAILVMKYLTELGIKRIFNFYKHPIKYAYDMGEGNPTDPNGLKGETGRWAYHVLEQPDHPVSIVRLKNTPKSRDHWLDICDKIIYAVGYEPNELPSINGQPAKHSYDDRSGIIAPRLFGIGIAFPEAITNSQGETEHVVGLIDFIEYAKRILPNWMQSKHGHLLLEEFEDLFTITRL